MCLACVEFQLGKLTLREFMNNVGEFPPHREAEELIQKTIEELLNAAVFEDLDDDFLYDDPAELSEDSG